MKHLKVVVPWRDGLHLRPAARLVQVGRKFRSKIVLSFGGKIADLRSILSIIALCGSLGATLDLEVTGDDEQDAARAVEQVFASYDGGDSSAGSSA